MKKKEQGRRAILRISLFISAVLLTALTFHSCQKDEMILEPEETGLKEGLISGISLIYPTVDVTVGADFNITYSSSCGRIMIERGFIKVKNTKVYGGLSCDMANLLWEPVGANVYADCQGGTITQNLAEPGTYVYRAKLNFKGNNIGCPDCAFAGTQYECFMITVALASSLETFTDGRDGKIYKMVTLGTQTWMAENLAYQTETGSFVYDNDDNNLATYGRLYNWDAAMAGCPTGWHLPSNAEWNTLVTYLTDNGYGYEGSGDDIAKALASKTGWGETDSPGTPGNDPQSNNSSAFAALPGGNLSWDGSFYNRDYYGFWWSSEPYNTDFMVCRRMYYNEPTLWLDGVPKNFGLSVRCVKDAE